MTDTLSKTYGALAAQELRELASHKDPWRTARIHMPTAPGWDPMPNGVLMGGRDAMLMVKEHDRTAEYDDVLRSMKPKFGRAWKYGPKALTDA